MDIVARLRARNGSCTPSGSTTPFNEGQYERSVRWTLCAPVRWGIIEQASLLPANQVMGTQDDKLFGKGSSVARDVPQNGEMHCQTAASIDKVHH